MKNLSKQLKRSSSVTISVAEKNECSYRGDGGVLDEIVNLKNDQDQPKKSVGRRAQRREGNKWKY